MTSNYVIDSNIVIKLYVTEDDSHQAESFLSKRLQESALLFAPTLLEYEFYNVMRRSDASAEQIATALEEVTQNSIHIISPSKTHFSIAYSIVDSGSAKSGFPSLYDAVFHALAIDYQGVFVTTDKKYYEKTKHFEHIALLSQLV